MVSLVEKWESIEQHTRLLDSSSRVGSYQSKNVKGGVEIRVRVGQFGFVKWYKDREDAERIHIEAFCETEGFHKIIGGKAAEFFYA